MCKLIKTCFTNYVQVDKQLFYNGEGLLNFLFLISSVSAEIQDIS